MDKSNPLITLGVSGLVLMLGIPVGAAAIIYEKVYVPNIILGTKEIKSGLNETKTLSFSLLSSANDAVIAGAFISIISAVLFSIGLTIVRHFSRHNIWGWSMVFPALLNFIGQIVILALVQTDKGKHPKATSTNEIRYVDGKYETDGKLYTREGWSCSMYDLYREREGSWAEKACSNLVCSFVSFPMLDLVC